MNPENDFSQPCTIVLKNDVVEVNRLVTFVEDACKAAHMDEATSFNIGLAMEEAVVNVMRYGYPEGTKGEVQVKTFTSDGKLTFEISDDGKPFDPTTVEDPDMSLSARQRPIGGLGIYLMRQFMDSMNYRREGDRNVLTLSKNLNFAL